jgi:hypothetical protein
MSQAVIQQLAPASQDAACKEIDYNDAPRFASLWEGVDADDSLAATNVLSGDPLFTVRRRLRFYGSHGTTRFSSASHDADMPASMDRTVFTSPVLVRFASRGPTA